MISKARTLFATIRHLTVKQLAYQLLYRFKSRVVSIQHYAAKDNIAFYKIQIPVSGTLIQSKERALDRKAFRFLNRSYTFQEQIDWGFADYGKLWNYNLQYFDYIHDNTLGPEDKIFLIEDFSAALIAGKVKPEPYPVSLRLINWTIFAGENDYRASCFIRSVTQQASYLQHNLEFHIQANHLLENYIALCFYALFSDDQNMLHKWLTKVKEQLNSQILPDGGHYECSPMYHSILLARLLMLYEALSGKNDTVKQLLPAEVLGRMSGWLNAFIFRSGDWVHANDATEGITASASEILEVSKKLGISIQDIQLKESGYRKMERGVLEMLIDVGPIMPSFQPGHAHADMMSFALKSGNKPLIVDTGISTYENNADRRFQRSTAAHNTVTINQDNQSEVWGSFRVGRRAFLTLEKDAPDHVIASHDGYKTKYGLLHKRSFEILPGDIFCITDEVFGKRRSAFCTVQAHIHFDHSIHIEIRKTDPGYRLDAGTAVIDIAGAIEVTIEEYDQALAYNTIVKAKALHVLFTDFLVMKIKAK